jgi:hypothetical protein
MDELITASGISLDLSEGIPIPLNLAIADFKEPDKRQRNFSKEISLPGTEKNQRYFASTFHVTQIGGVYDFNSSAKVNCTYYKKGTAVLKNAVLKLNKVVILDGVPSFKVGLFSDFVDTFLLLSTTDVRELDWSAYNHTLTNTNIQSSWSTPLGTGYYYPLIERNQRIGISKWRNTDMIPYVHYVDVFIKCMELAGQKFTSTALATNRVKSVLYGYGGGNYVNTAISPAEQNNRKVLTNAGAISMNIEEVLSFNVVTGAITYAPIPFSGNITLTEVQDVYNQMVGAKFTAARTGVFKLQLIGQVRFKYSVTSATYLTGGSRVLGYRKNGIDYPIATLTQSSVDQTFTLNTVTNIDLQQGDEVEIVFGECTTLFSFASLSPTILLQVTTTTPLQINYTSLDTSIVEGSMVEVGRFLPSMKCSDFILGFIKTFKLMITDPDIYGVVKIEPEVTFYQGTNVFTDITPEVDHSREIEIRPSANEYAKTLSYSFKTGTETDAKDYLTKWKTPYGDMSFDQPSFFAKGEQKIELPFGTIIPYQVYPGVIVPRFIDVDSNGVKKTTEGVPRIMFRNGLKAGNWQLVGSSTLNLTSYPCVHHFDNFQNPTFDLNWQLVEELMYASNVVTTKNLFSEYYAQFVNEIISKEGKYVQLYRKMNNSQIEKLDWSRLLMWNGAVFRFNKILDFDSEVTEVTKIEMIKVLEAKSINRGLISTGPKLPAIKTNVKKGLSMSVGTGALVLSGGKGNQVLETSKALMG